MKLTFCGAAGMVTGSCYLVEVGNDKVLVDCGMFQGSKEITRLNYQPFLFDPKKISCVLLTHAHIDHSGLLPKLEVQGFRGRVLAHPATIDLCRIMLEDSAHLNEVDTEHENKRRAEEGLPPRRPLYTVKDVKKTHKLFKKIDYDEPVQLTRNIKVCYRDAGHIIGSAMIEMFVTENGVEKKIVFSGDIGQWNVPLVKDPTLIKEADYVLIESTYGDRLHEDIGIRDDLLLEYSKETFEKGGKLLIPSFAIERTQELLYSFNKLIKTGKFPEQEIFLDSPLAIKATEVFKKHSDCCFDEEALTTYKDPFSFPELVYTLSVEDSKRLNSYDKPCVVIAGNGTCTGGRIRHHLRHNIENEKNTVLFVGYQPEGTLGRWMIEGAKEIRMMGLKLQVKAKVCKINSFSAHADARELVKWAKGFAAPKKIFIVHGEPRAASALSSKLEEQGFDCHIPNRGETIQL